MRFQLFPLSLFLASLSSGTIFVVALLLRVHLHLVYTAWEGRSKACEVIIRTWKSSTEKTWDSTRGMNKFLSHSLTFSSEPLRNPTTHHINWCSTANKSTNFLLLFLFSPYFRSIMASSSFHISFFFASNVCFILCCCCVSSPENERKKKLK